MLIHLKKRTQLPRYCLGEVLLESGVITPSVLNSSVATAQKTRSMLGRVMVMSGHLTELDVECALKIQKSIRDGSLYMNLAKELLQFAHSYQVTLNEAYQYENVRRQWGFVSRLGKLVLGAGILNEAELSKAMHYSLQTSYPLGQSLVQLGLIADTTLLTCLNLQVLVRDGHLSFLDAVRALRRIELEGETLESLLIALNLRDGEQRPIPKVGELLVAANLLSPDDSIIVTELGIEKNMQYGDLVVSFGLLSETVIDAAVQLQKQFGNPSFTLARSSRLLNMVNKTQTPLGKILSDLDALNQAVELLQSTQIFGNLTSESAPMCDLEVAVAEMLVLDQGVQVENMQKALATMSQLQKIVTSYNDAQQLILQIVEREKHKVASKAPTLNRLPAITSETPPPVSFRKLDHIISEKTDSELTSRIIQLANHNAESEMETVYENLQTEPLSDYSELEATAQIPEDLLEAESSESNSGSISDYSDLESTVEMEPIQAFAEHEMVSEGSVIDSLPEHSDSEASAEVSTLHSEIESNDSEPEDAVPGFTVECNYSYADPGPNFTNSAELFISLNSELTADFLRLVSLREQNAESASGDESAVENVQSDQQYVEHETETDVGEEIVPCVSDEVEQDVVTEVMNVEGNEDYEYVENELATDESIPCTELQTEEMFEETIQGEDTSNADSEEHVGVIAA